MGNGKSTADIRHLEPRRILVRGVNWLGDAVMTTPALQRLRERFPDAHITLLTPEKLAPLWQHHPCINEVMGFAPSESLWSVAAKLRFSPSPEALTEALRDYDAEGARSPMDEFKAARDVVLALLPHTLAPQFDLALVLPNSHRSALEVWLARIPHRLGYARPLRNRFLTQALAPREDHLLMRKRSIGEIEELIHPPSRTTRRAPATPKPDEPESLNTEQATHIAKPHQIHDYLQLVAALGANPEPVPPTLEVTAAELKQAEQSLLSELWNNSAGPAPGSWPIVLGLNPGAKYGPAKRWPAENFAAVAREVSRRLQNSVWLTFGTEKDSKLCDRIATLAGVRVLNLAGKTSLRELMAQLKLCRVLLTNDSGPMHVAAALGTPVVVPFGSTSPDLTGPGLPGDTRHRLLKSGAPCSPCFRRTCPIDFRCMTTFNIGRVMEAVLQVAAMER